jgi:hypothetical protein
MRIVFHTAQHLTAVIPAKAGIQSGDGTFPEIRGMDSRFRGNDRDLRASYQE